MFSRVHVLCLGVCVIVVTVMVVRLFPKEMTNQARFVALENVCVQGVCSLCIKMCTIHVFMLMVHFAITHAEAPIHLYHIRKNCSLKTGHCTEVKIERVI